VRLGGHGENSSHDLRLSDVLAASWAWGWTCLSCGVQLAAACLCLLTALNKRRRNRPEKLPVVRSTKSHLFQVFVLSFECSVSVTSITSSPAVKNAGREPTIGIGAGESPGQPCRRSPAVDRRTRRRRAAVQATSRHHAPRRRLARRHRAALHRAVILHAVPRRADHAVHAAHAPGMQAVPGKSSSSASSGNRGAPASGPNSRR
jgi:hypothetical protein